MRRARRVNLRALALRHAADELVDVERLCSAGRREPGSELGRQLLREVARLARRDPLGEGLERRPGGALGVLPRAVRLLLDQLQERFVPIAHEWISSRVRAAVLTSEPVISRACPPRVKKLNIQRVITISRFCIPIR